MGVTARPQYTQESVDQQLQQIHLLDPSSSSENLEQLGPIIKQIHANRQQDAFLRTVQGLIQSKDADIEKICAENYQDFISSVSTLFSVKDYTTRMKDKITTLDASVSQLGRGLVEKKRTVLQLKKTAGNMDEAIDNLQACLRVLDVVNRVGEMIKQGRYWSALRSLEDIQNMPPTSLSQTPFYQHLLSSLPSLRAQIKDAVTASMKQWLLMVRTVSGDIGRLALESMETRTRRWRTRREKDPLLRTSRVGSAVELVTHEKTEFNVLDNEKVKVDFKPLFEGILIYSALNSLNELQKSYQADRKAQSDLILPDPLPLASLPSLTQEISGFFIVESNVLESTDNFRSDADVAELWDAMTARLSGSIDASLRSESDPEAFLKAKECLLGFIMTLESPLYSTASLHSFILVLFEKYAILLEAQFSKRFASIIQQDDNLPMHMEKSTEIQTVLDVVWLNLAEKDEIVKSTLPMNLPWSQSFYLCCEDIRGFIQKFYQFVEGVSQHHRNIDELLGKSLDHLLIRSISESMARRLEKITTLSQVAQIVTNIEHFLVACIQLERSLTSLRSSQKGGSIRLTASSSFTDTLTQALGRMQSLIKSKLDDFFDVAEYVWTPNHKENEPSMYLYGLVDWLTTVVDDMVIKGTYKDDAYMSAAAYMADSFVEYLTGRNIPIVNENALSNVLIDIDFLEQEFKRIQRPNLASSFGEIRSLTSIILNDTVHEYLIPATRAASYSALKPKKLAALLHKLAKYGASQRDAASRDLGEKRRKEGDMVSRIYPGESRA